MVRFREELMRPRASPLLVQGLAMVTAVHLARDYGITDEESHGAGPALPGFKLRQVTDWMAGHLAEEFSLDRIAAQAPHHFRAGGQPAQS